MQTIGSSAALAGVPVGVQAQGIWAGRRQLFVRFAGEAETATMYTSAALGSELKRLTERSAVHSISVGGRDALANAEFLLSAFESWMPTKPVMIDTDGQRPDRIAPLRKVTQMIQVSVAQLLPGIVGRAMETLAEAKKSNIPHAFVLLVGSEASDGQILRVIEQTKEASDQTAIVIHPMAGTDRTTLDRRWSGVMERATLVHGDTRLVITIPPPTGIS